MSQHKPPGMSNEQYLNELLAEHEKHKSLVGDARFPHSDRLLVAEIERVTASSEALKVNANWKLHEVRAWARILLRGRLFARRAASPPKGLETGKNMR